MKKSSEKAFEAAFDKLTKQQQDEIIALAAECNAIAAAHAAAVDEEQRTSAEQRRLYMRYEKRAKALGLPVSDEICFR